jgi:phosphoribosylamine--glycine ligase
MATRGTPFIGTLYAGLMIGAQGARVVEFNARFGDPETEVVLPLLDGSLADLLAGAAAGALDPSIVERRRDAALTVALVAEGYPESARPGGRIAGLERLDRREDLLVFHAATTWNDGWVVSGGRAAHVAARAATLEDARQRVYDAIDTLAGSGWTCRRDIGAPAVAEVPQRGGAA